MPARQSNGLRVFIALLGTVVPLAPSVVSGCASSPSAGAPPASTLGMDATVPLGTVVTGGGGGPTSSSSSGAIQNPFGDLPTPDSGSSPESGSSSGGGSDDGSASGDAASSGGGSSDASDSGPVGPPPNMCIDYVAPMCGPTPCDLRSNTCCISLMLQTRCVPNPMGCDPTEASIHCLQACECGGNSVCCGVANTIVGAVQSECQTVPDGGLCNPHPQTNTEASEQLCATDGECKTGQACVKQTCEFGVTLNICGLQSQDPFDCHL